ncbi:histidine phosphatase family protein [Thermodesulfobacteriota bacterium]
MRQKNHTLLWVVIIWILCLSVGCTGAEVHSKPGTTTTVILIRHAERDEGGHLTSKGHRQARALVDAVGDMGIAAIYSIDMERNLDTVRPLAKKLGINITLTPDISILEGKRVVNEILTEHAGGVVLWVGNVTGNLQAVYRQLGGTGKGPLEYGDLYILTIPDKGAVGVVKTRYGSKY